MAGPAIDLMGRGRNFFNGRGGGAFGNFIESLQKTRLHYLIYIINIHGRKFKTLKNLKTVSVPHTNNKT